MNRILEITEQDSACIDFTPISSDDISTDGPFYSMVDNTPLPRAVADPLADIPGYSEGLTAAINAQKGADALRQAHAGKLEAVRKIDLEYKDLVVKAKAGVQIAAGAAYKIQVEKASAEADVALSAEAIASADQDVARAKDRIKHVLKAELHRFLVRLQAKEAEAAKVFGAAKRELNTAATHANRIMVAVTSSAASLTAEDCAILLGIRG